MANKPRTFYIQQRCPPLPWIQDSLLDDIEIHLSRWVDMLIDLFRASCEAFDEGSEVKGTPLVFDALAELHKFGFDEMTTLPQILSRCGINNQELAHALDGIQHRPFYGMGDAAQFKANVAHNRSTVVKENLPSSGWLYTAPGKIVKAPNLETQSIQLAHLRWLHSTVLHEQTRRKA